jgi:beta-lactamase class A
LKVKGFVSILRWVSVGLIFVAALLTGLQLVSYSRIRAVFPQGMVIAGVPVDGLNQQQAAERLVEAYGVPVELHYGNAVVQVKPAVLGFELDLESMMAAADLERVSQPFWTAFWDYLWNRLPKPAEVPLSASVSEDRLRSYLKNEIVIRYDQPSVAAIPVAGSVNFSQGVQGTALDIDRAVVLISDALRSPNVRVVNLTYNKASPPRPSLQNLQILLQQIIDLAQFDGLAEIYMLDLESGQELSFAYRQGLNLTPGIAFTAASTMKIPIMMSIFRRIKEPAPPDITNLLELMIERSENDPADRLMEQVIDKNLGPLEVTSDLQTLGLQSTFLAGYFYPGAPLLKRFTTPANSRADVQTSPDPYNQTTPAEIGMLLDDIYQCADSGGGTFAAVFPGQISQNECRQMITYLTRNRIAVLIQAGLPEGTQIAHKHGWITENDGLIHHISDAGIVYTPGGNYVLAIYLYHPVQILFDPVNQMVAQLSSAVYNYFNYAGK